MICKLTQLYKSYFIHNRRKKIYHMFKLRRCTILRKILTYFEFMIGKYLRRLTCNRSVTLTGFFLRVSWRGRVSQKQR